MGIAERREREKKDRRKTILNCAKDLILEHGAKGISMEDIAHKAELSKATVYLYFSGKEILFNEIQNESAQIFLERFKSSMKTNLTGMNAIRHLWLCFIELFGNSNELIIAFKIHNYLNPGLPFISEGQNIPSNINAIIVIIKTLINQCKKEGVFDPNLDSDMATHMLLTMFSNMIETVAGMPANTRKSPAFFSEMTKTFQIVIYGFAKEGIKRSSLNIQHPD